MKTFYQLLANAIIANVTNMTVWFALIFFIGPIAQLIFIPFMTTGAGVGLIGGWFVTGADRGLALVFTLTGIIGLIMTLIAMNTKYYKLLSNRYMTDKNNILPEVALT